MPRDDSGGMAHELWRQLGALLAAHVQSLVARITSAARETTGLWVRPHPASQSTSAARPSGSNADSAACISTQESLRRLQWTCCTFARRHFCEIVEFLVQWLVEADAAASTVASWVGAHLLVSIFQDAYESAHEAMVLPDTAHLETTVELVMDRCVQVFYGAHASAQAMETTSSFFPFKSIQSPRPAQPPTDAAVLMERTIAQWRCVVAWVARYSLTLVRARVQRELLAKPSPNSGSDAARAHPLLTNLSELRLRLTTRTLLHGASVPLTHKLKDAAMFLKVLQPVLHKPAKTAVRAAMTALVATILKRELLHLEEKSTYFVYTTSHASEWSSCISDLHALAVKYSTKKAFVAVGWELRIAVLSLAPNDIFGRYWKDDVHSLLRLQHQHNKDSSSSARATTLASIGLCFSQLLYRHFAIERKLPSELDCMEIINTTQAWCFFSFSHKQKPSLQTFEDRTLPILVDLTLGIAAYNMTYAVQSHLRRLLTEADSIFDEKKLAGLEALNAICQRCQKKSVYSQEPAVQVTTAITSMLDKKTLAAHHHMLGGLVGHILIECNAHFGHELLLDTHAGETEPPFPSSSTPLNQSTSSSFLSVASTLLSTRSTRDDYKRAVAIHIYGAALRSLEFVYTALELREEQTMLLLVRASIHAEPYVRQCAHHALHCIVSMKLTSKIAADKPAVSAVFRGLTDFLLRMTGNHAIAKNDIEASIILIRLLGSLVLCASRLLSATNNVVDDPNDRARPRWDSGRELEESLLQADAVCVYLLINDDIELRTKTFETLQAVRKVRHLQTNDDDLSGTRCCCVLDVIDAMDKELQQLCFSFLPEQELMQIRATGTVDDDSSSNNERGHLDHRGGFWFQLLLRDSRFPRRGFRWAAVLSRLFLRLANALPQVTTYIWSDANGKILKLEPMLPLSVVVAVQGGENSDRDIARWRNLSILATATACPNLAAVTTSRKDVSSVSRSPADEESLRSERDSISQSNASVSVQSVISSSAVNSLFKRLARYLKSYSSSQRKAAILALGSTHPLAIAGLLGVLERYDAGAFPQPVGPASHLSQQGGDTSTPNGPPASSLAANVLSSAHRMQFRQHGKTKSSTDVKMSMHFHLQWALGRIYRLILEQRWHERHRLCKLNSCDDGNHHRLSDDGVSDRFLRLSRAFLDHMSVSLAINYEALVSDAKSLLFMMQQDFCATVKALLHLMSKPFATQSVNPSCIAATTTTNLPGSMREKLFDQIISWCPPSAFTAIATSKMSVDIDSRAFFTFGSPLRTVWMQHCDVFGDVSGRVDQAATNSEPHASDASLTLLHWMDGIEVTGIDTCQTYFFDSFRAFDDARALGEWTAFFALTGRRRLSDFPVA